MADSHGTAQTRAKNKYNAKAYDRIALQVKKGRKETLKAHAEQHGESLNGFINRAIDEAMERSNGTRQQQRINFTKITLVTHNPQHSDKEHCHGFR